MAKTADHTLTKQPSPENLLYVKKGWLVRQTDDKNWPKYWCVLTDRALTFYADPKGDSMNSVEGVVNLIPTTTVHDLSLSRNFAFKIITEGREYVLSASTVKIRNGWTQSILQCVDALVFHKVPTGKSFSDVTAASKKQDSFVGQRTLLCVTATQKDNSQDVSTDNGVKSPGYSWPYRSSSVTQPPVAVDVSSPTDDSSLTSGTMSPSAEVERHVRDTRSWSGAIPSTRTFPQRFVENKSTNQNARLASSVDRQRFPSETNVPLIRSKTVELSVNQRNNIGGGDYKRVREQEDVLPRRRRREVLEELEAEYTESSSTASSIQGDEPPSFTQFSRPVSHHAPVSRLQEKAQNKSVQRVLSPPPVVPMGSADLTDDVDSISESAKEFEQLAIRNLLELLDAEVQSLKIKLAEALKSSDAKTEKIRTLSQQLSRPERRDDNVGDQRPSDTERLRKDLLNCKQKIAELEKVAERRQQDVSILEVQLQKSTQHVDIVTADMEKVSTQLKQKEETISALIQELDDKTKVTAEMESLSRQLRDNNSKMETLQRTCLDRVRNAENERDTLERRVRQLQGKLDEEKVKQSNDARNSSVTIDNRPKLEALVEQLEAQLLEANAKLELTTKELESEMAENGRHLVDLRENIGEIAGLQQDLSREKKSASGLEADVKYLRDELAAVVKQVAEKETKNVLLRQDLEQVEVKAAALADENTTLAMAREELKIKFQTLESVMSEKDVILEQLRAQLNAETVGMSNKYQSSLADLKAAQLSIVELEEKIEVQRKKSVDFEVFDRTMKELDITRKRLDSVTEELKCSRRDADEDLHDRDGKMAEMRVFYETLEAECERLKVDGTKADAEMVVELDKVKQQYETILNEKITELTATQKLFSDLRLELENRASNVSERTAVETEVIIPTNADAQLVRRDSLAGQDFGTEADLRDKYMFTVRQLKRLTSERKLETSRIAELEQTVSHLRENLRKAEIVHVERVDALNDKIQQLNAKLSGAERRIVRLRRGKVEGSSTDDESFTATEDCVDTAVIDARIVELETRLSEVEREKLELARRVVLQNDEIIKTTQDVEFASVVDRNLFEEFRNWKNRDETSTLAREDAVDPSVCNTRELAELRDIFDDPKNEIKRKEASYQQEIQALRDGYEIRIRSLQHDLVGTRQDLAHAQQEKEEDLAMYEKRIAVVDTELRNAKSGGSQIEANLKEKLRGCQSALKKLEEDLKKAREVSDEADVKKETEEDRTVASLRGTVEELMKQLEDERKSHSMTVQQLRRDPSIDPDFSAHLGSQARVRQLEEQMRSMRADYEQELAMQKTAHRRELIYSKEDISQQLAAAEANSIPIDEESIRKKYLKEVDRIKEMYDRGFKSMDKSHERTMMDMRKNHKQDLDRLRLEKDELLMEETQATQAALDAMRKAHEAELQRERNKFLDLISKTYCQADMESLQRQHDDDMQLIQYEMRQLSEQYTIKCLENAAVSERLNAQTKALHDSRKRVQDLLVRNDELNTRLKYDIEKLNRLAARRYSAADDSETSPESSDNKLTMQVKEAEVLQLQDALSALQYRLEITSEELKECNEKYHELLMEYQSCRRSLENSTLSDAPRSRRSFDAMSLRPDGSFGRGDHSSDVSQDDFLVKSNSSSEISLSKLEEFSDRSASSIPPPSEFQSDPVEAVQSRRSLWRIKNPQRARSSPAVPEYLGLTLQKAASVDPERLSGSIPSRKSMGERSQPAADWDCDSVESGDT